MASNTPDQTRLLNDYPGHGKTIDISDENSISAFLNEVIHNKQHIREKMFMRFSDQKITSWETEEEKLLKTWNLIVK